jgi:dihydroorotase-like cyclic amidohydrolase
VVRNNRIVSVGPRGQAPPNARVIDVAGKTIVPGFVDTHAHMWNLWGVHWSRPWIYSANLAYGVTTTRDPQTATTDVLVYEDRVRAGHMPGPRVYSTGPGVFLFDGVRSLEHARDVLRRYSDYYDTKTFKMYMAGNRRQRQWLIMAARELQLMPTTHHPRLSGRGRAIQGVRHDELTNTAGGVRWALGGELLLHQRKRRR